MAAALVALLGGAIGVASDSLSDTTDRLRALVAQAGEYPSNQEPSPPGQDQYPPDEAMGPEIPSPVPNPQGEGRLAPPGDEVLDGQGSEGGEAVHGGEAVDPGSAVTGSHPGDAPAPTSPEPRVGTEPAMPPPGPTPPPPGAEGYAQEEQPGAEGGAQEEAQPGAEGYAQEEAQPGVEGAPAEAQAGVEGSALDESLAGGKGGALGESLAGGEGGALEESLAGAEGVPNEESLAGAEARAGAGAAAPPGETEEELQARLSGLEADLADQRAAQEEQAAADDQRVAELENNFDDLQQRGASLEENRASRVERLQSGIDGMRYVFQVLSVGSSDLDGDLSMVADELQGVSQDAARYAGPREAELASRSEAAVQAAREAIAREDLYAARIELGIALANARAAQAAAADGTQQLFR